MQVSALKILKSFDFNICVCTNSRPEWAMSILRHLKALMYIDKVITADDVKKPKPDPEMLYTAMNAFDAQPSETIIIEDSEPGLMAAHASGAYFIAVDNPFDWTFSKIHETIQTIHEFNNEQS
jgi:HAD superfamily hydrolase (TIGR01509 family)